MADGGDQAIEDVSKERGEKEPPLSESNREQNEQEEPPVSLEKVREATADSLAKGIEFWKTPVADTNADTSFMSYQNRDRRALLETSFRVISNQEAFSDPAVLRTLIAAMGREVRQDVPTSETGVSSSSVDEIAEANATNTTEPEVQESQVSSATEPTVPTDHLQQSVLSIVHELLFEQLYADLMQCKTTIQKQKSHVISLVSNQQGIDAGGLQEQISKTQLFQSNAGIFDRYLAQGEGLMRTCLRSPEMANDSMSALAKITKARLEAITEEYAEDSDTDGLAKVIQIGPDGRVSPLSHFENERSEVMGDLISENTFLNAVVTLQSRLASLQSDPSEQTELAVEEAKTEVIYSVQAGEVVQVVDQTEESSATPADHSLASDAQVVSEESETAV